MSNTTPDHKSAKAASESPWWFKRHPVLGAVIGGLMLLQIIVYAVSTMAPEVDPSTGLPTTETTQTP